MSRFARPTLAFAACAAMLSLSACSLLPFGNNNDTDAPQPSASPSTSTDVSNSTSEPSDSPTSAPTPTNSTPPGTRIGLADMEAEHCYSNFREDTRDVEETSCNSPHDFEVFHTFPLTQAARPSDAELSELVQTQCEAAYEDYAGIPSGSSTLAITRAMPSQQSWDEGRRLALCMAQSKDGSKLSQSVKNSRM